jgi:uncharacterized protein (DUF433 family)
MAKHPRIEIDPDVMVGKPVIRGTRITVEIILHRFAEGYTLNDIREDYPHLTAADVHAALAYAADAVARPPQRPDGKWANKRNDASRASSIHDTQKAAEAAARKMLGKQGGGELTTQGRDHRIRSKDTIPPGNDLNPPRDREH